jgi:MraZ protein
MFTGQFNHTLDDKNRLALPARYRTHLEVDGGVMMTTGAGKHVLIYPMTEFEKLATKIDALSLMDADAATLRRQLYMDATAAQLDKQGRVLLPENLRAHAEIRRDVVIVGLGKFIEVWTPQHWAQAKAEVQAAATQAHLWAKLGI